ncbi:hypothetical protein HAX54_049829, partial [Datura stramonium]|nr:hypothetical protein [Datura stramonium]
PTHNNNSWEELGRSYVESRRAWTEEGDLVSDNFSPRRAAPYGDLPACFVAPCEACPTHCRPLCTGGAPFSLGTCSFRVQFNNTFPFKPK